MSASGLTPPLSRSYWVIPGRFAAGVYPGAFAPGEARTKLRKLLEAGITTWIDLTRAEEPFPDRLEPYTLLLAEESAVSGLRAVYLNYPIIDMSIPPRDEMRRILAALNQALAQNETVYLHCWGGRGRTGTVVGCWLVEQGLSGPEALVEIERLRAGMPGYDRSQPSPETEAQRTMVLTWANT